MSACDSCLRRAALLGLLAGALDRERARIDALLASSDDELLEAVGGRRAASLAAELSEFDASRHRARVAAAGLWTVCRCSPVYPDELRALAAPPVALYLTAAPELLVATVAQRPVAIVGARRASPYGLQTARGLAGALAHAGTPIVSGMALGIDGAAHDGALGATRAQAIAHDGALGATRAQTIAHDDARGASSAQAAAHGAGPGAAAAGEPRVITVAVLPGGADRAYPSSHRRLYERIRTHGIALSELAPGVTPRRWMFPARNRIIAALSAITVVVQARPRSGALVTARHASAMGRLVGAVPGQVESPLSAGPHALIRDGARLIADASDVLDAVHGPGLRPLPDSRLAALSSSERALLDAIAEGFDGVAAFRRAELDVSQGLEAVAGLELAGVVRRAAGGRLLVTASPA